MISSQLKDPLFSLCSHAAKLPGRIEKQIQKSLLVATVAMIAGAALFLLSQAYAGSKLFTLLPVAFCGLGASAVLAAIYRCVNFSHSEPSLDLESLNKMHKNARKAVHEHKIKEFSPYTTIEQALPRVDDLRASNNPPFYLIPSCAENKGRRPAMEDAHFFNVIDRGFIFGVLDGHHGDSVAKFAAGKFTHIFCKQLEMSPSNIYKAFNTAFEKMQSKISKRNDWDGIGSTAVIAFVDKSNRIFTATLGDSELNLYRKNAQGQWGSIPLSCVRDWRHPREARRAALALNQPELAEKWPAQKSKPRFPMNVCGTNVSRALGDQLLATFPIGQKEADKTFPGVIHKPKITVNQLKSKDILIAACDGLKDFVCESEIVVKVEELAEKVEDLARNLALYALHEKHSNDNITVLTVKVI